MVELLDSGTGEELKEKVDLIAKNSLLTKGVVDAARVVVEPPVLTKCPKEYNHPTFSGARPLSAHARRHEDAPGTSGRLHRIGGMHRHLLS